MTPEVLNTDTYTKIWYRNRGDVCDHILILDLDNKIIEVQISEYDDDGTLLANRVFGADGVTEIAHRLHDEHGFRDYRKINDEWVLTQWTRSEWLVAEQRAKCSWYNGLDELVFYEIFENDPECGMVVMGYYTPDDEPFYFNEQVPPPEKMATLQSYTDY